MSHEINTAPSGEHQQDTQTVLDIYDDGPSSPNLGWSTQVRFQGDRLVLCGYPELGEVTKIAVQGEDLQAFLDLAATLVPVLPIAFLCDGDGDWWISAPGETFQYLGQDFADWEARINVEGVRTLDQIAEIYGISDAPNALPEFHLIDRWGDAWTSHDQKNWTLASGAATYDPWSYERIEHLFGVDSRRVTS